MIKKIFNYIGIWIEKDETNPYTYDSEEYKNTDEEKIKKHIELLKSLEKKEDDRLTIIDTKTSQIITYTGFIFSALSLFIPILLDKIPEQGFMVRIVFIVALVFAFLFYIITIHNAIRNYNIKKFHYSRSDPRNVIKYQYELVSDFSAIEIKDLLYSYNLNSKTNDEKANNLIFAYRTFRIANILTAFIGILICYSLLFVKPKENCFSIKNPVQIQNIDSIRKIAVKPENFPFVLNNYDTTNKDK